MDFCCCQNKGYIIGRFLHDFQQGIKGTGREHVHLIDDVDLMRTAFRQINRSFPQFPHVLYTIIRGSIDFDDIGKRAGICISADVTGAAGCTVLAVGAVHCLCQNAGTGCFAGSTGSCKQVRMCCFLLNQLIAQSGCDVGLRDDIVKCFGTPCSIQCLVHPKIRLRFCSLSVWNNMEKSPQKFRNIGVQVNCGTQNDPLNAARSPA